MKGDFSRWTFDARKHYNAVLKQQGRVDLDADWNEQVEIGKHLSRTAIRDIVGTCGFPRDAAGFEISVQDGKVLRIGNGRGYVAGILCEVDQPVRYHGQPDYPNPPDVLRQLDESHAGRGLVYLDVWQRHLTAFDDPDIREEALGGPDTATRTRTVWQVKVLPVKSGTGSKGKPADSLCKSGAGRIDCPEWSRLVAALTGTMRAAVQPGPARDDSGSSSPSSGYRGAENRLYRVEVHESGTESGASFKWSRDNGTVVARIAGIAGQELRLGEGGKEVVRNLTTGQWLEMADDGLELKRHCGVLVQVAGVDPSRQVVAIRSETPLPTVSVEGRPKLRRWDQTGSASEVRTGVPVTGDWQELEEGIRVRFSVGSYRAGDYWLIPARTATKSIQWPVEPDGTSVARPPLGIRHHYCPLAVLKLAGSRLVVEADCRRIFPPLTG